MNTKMTKELPTSGQFIVVWLYNGKLWSDIFRTEDGVLEVYIDEDDDWEHRDWDDVLSESQKLVGYVIQEPPEKVEEWV